MAVIAHVVLASQAREDANDTMIAHYSQRATATECQLSLSLALTEVRKAVKGLQEQERLLVEAASSVEERRAA